MGLGFNGPPLLRSKDSHSRVYNRSGPAHDRTVTALYLLPHGIPVSRNNR